LAKYDVWGSALKLTRMFARHEQKSVGAKVIRNAVFSGLRLLLLAPLPLVVVPFFLKKLGTSGYGTWAVFLAVSGVTSLADIGLVATLSKHVAELYALKDFRALSRLINTGFALYLLIACLLASILLINSRLLLAILFRGSSVPFGELQVLWHYLTLLIIANILTMMLSSVVIGLQRMDLSAGLTSLNLLSSAGLSLVFLSWNLGLRGILYSYVLTGWFTFCAYVFVLRKLLPEVRLNPSDCRWVEAREILSFSLKTYVTQVAVVIHNQIEKLYLARFVGVVSVGWYDIPSDLAVKLRGIPSLVLVPVMPAAAELNALGDQDRLRNLYFRAHKYLAFIGVPFVLYIAFVSKQFVDLWVGASLSVIAFPLSVLLIVNFVNLMTGPGSLLLVAAGKLKPGLYSAVLGILLNLCLSLFLIRAYGFPGAVVGTSLSLVIASGFFLWMFQRETCGLYSKVMRRAYPKPVACSLSILVVLSILTNSEQPSSWSQLVFHGLAFSVAYFFLLLLLRFFDRFDLAIVEGFVPVHRLARRIIPGA
jgi:O-antigen/teichoic acid export membrane protein